MATNSRNPLLLDKFFPGFGPCRHLRHLPNPERLLPDSLHEFGVCFILLTDPHLPNILLNKPQNAQNSGNTALQRHFGIGCLFGTYNCYLRIPRRQNWRQGPADHLFRFSGGWTGGVCGGAGGDRPQTLPIHRLRPPRLNNFADFVAGLYELCVEEDGKTLLWAHSLRVPPPPFVHTAVHIPNTGALLHADTMGQYVSQFAAFFGHFCH